MNSFASYIYLIASIILAACGTQDSEDKGSSTEYSASNPIIFKGFVQRAFPITVEGVSFNDSEHFYTRFIDDLIYSNQEYATALEGAKIEIEGEYGVTRFGSDASVFLSSEQNEGHIFQSRTASNAEFKVEVVSESLDESFKARVIIRIGLVIDSGDHSSQHYCYILHSIIDGISIDEHTKPIIFNDFYTQLNEYNCSDRNGIDIDIDRGIEGSVKDNEGSTVLEPTVMLQDEFSLDHELDNREFEGNVKIIHTSNTKEKILVTFGKLRSKHDGTVSYHALELTDDFGSGELTKIVVGESLDSYGRYCYFLPYESGFLLKPCNQVSNRFLTYYSDAREFTPIGRSQNHDGQHLMFEKNGELFQFNPGYQLCKVGPEYETTYYDCEELPDSNPSKTFKSCAASISEINCLVINEQESVVYRYNLNGVFQEKYHLSRLSFSNDIAQEVRLVSDGHSFYFVYILGEKVVFTPYLLTQ